LEIDVSNSSDDCDFILGEGDLLGEVGEGWFFIHEELDVGFVEDERFGKLRSAIDPDLVILVFLVYERKGYHT
jgi:hypothetical protein